jgi:hypothetical protein
VSITLAGGNGTYWLCLHRDLSTAVAGWTRRAGSHYLWQLAGSQPADPAGGLCFASITVAGAVITAVTPLPTPTSQPMSKQLANAVAMTGGSATLTTLTVTGAAQVSTLRSTGTVGLDFVPQTDAVLTLGQARNLGRNALVVRAAGNDVGAYAALFLNVAAATVGSIYCNATGTTYATTSDQRLKHSITPLTGALATLLALRPVNFTWNADDSQDEGFLAHELQQHIPHAVTGEPDQVNEDGSIKPQQVDHSKLVVWLVGAVQTLAAKVQALEEALGV